MFRSWLTPRVLVGLASAGLLVWGLVRLFDVRTPNRPVGDWTQISELPQRDDLNVVFVLVDTLRADRLSAYGYERPTSPIFDALASSGILFRNVLAQSTWTKCSMASIWTATYPSTHGITRFQHALPEAFESPAEILQKAGLMTVGIWRNGWTAPTFGFQQGFDLYYKPRVRNELALHQNNPSAFTLRGTDHDLTLSAVEFLRTVAKKSRFLLYVHYMDVHQYVYDDSANFGSSFSDIYDNSVRWVDGNLGTLFAVLQQEELMKRTIFVVASDHGEAFGEHGIEGHARNLYGETSYVPLLFVLPFRLEEGIVVDAPVENIDIWPTLLDLLGLPPMKGVQGRSLVPQIEAAAQGRQDGQGPRPRFAQLDQTWGRREEPAPLVSVIDGRYRLFHHATAPEQDELYDIHSDPGEQRDLAAQQPEELARLREEVARYSEPAPPPWGTPPEEVALDDLELGMLRALGYVVHDDEDEDGGKEAGGDGAEPTEAAP